jgi:hypothetical protein
MFRVQIMDQSTASVSLYTKEVETGKDVLEWAKKQAVEIFGEGAQFRFLIEEVKPE